MEDETTVRLSGKKEPRFGELVFSRSPCFTCQAYEGHRMFCNGPMESTPVSTPVMFKGLPLKTKLPLFFGILFVLLVGLPVEDAYFRFVFHAQLPQCLGISGLRMCGIVTQ